MYTHNDRVREFCESSLKNFAFFPSNVCVCVYIDTSHYILSPRAKNSLWNHYAVRRWRRGWPFTIVKKSKLTFPI